MKRILAIVVAVLGVFGNVAYAVNWPASMTYAWHAQRIHKGTKSDCNTKIMLHSADNIAASARTGNLDNWDCDEDNNGSVDLCTSGSTVYVRCSATTPDNAVHKFLVENTLNAACIGQAGDYGWATVDVKRTSDTITPVGTLSSDCVTGPAGGTFTGNPGFQD